MSAQSLVTEYLDLWASTINARNTQGHGSSKKRELYGIKKLRELILELAVRGKLVSQNSNDEPASVLLQQIKDKKVKKQKSLSERTEEEMPFELPEGWKWVRLGDISTINGGFAFKSSQYVEDGVRVVRISDFDGKGFKDKKIVRHHYSDLLEPYVLEVNNILMAMTGGTVGKSFLVNSLHEKMVVNQRVATIKIPSCISSRFISYVLQTSTAQSVVHEAKNSTNDNISMSDIKGFFIPFPSYAEQHRIVVKVEELMALCDQLEQKTECSLGAHNLLVDSLLSTLTDARDANEFGDNWARLADHFDALITTDYAVEQLKQTILQLAVMGKLVRQDPADVPASGLLEQIADRKAQLIEDRKIRKQKPLPQISDEEKMFEIPEGWELVRIADVAGLASGKGFKKSEYSEAGARLFQIANVSTGYVKWDVENYMPMQYLDDYPELKLYSGDVLIALNRPLLSNKMKVCIISESDLPAILYQRVGRFNFYGSSIDTGYFYYYMQSALFISQLNENLQGSDQPFINLSQLVAFNFTLPPVKEQSRIVAKVDELLLLCSQLKTRLNEAQATRLHLTDTVVERTLTV